MDQVVSLVEVLVDGDEVGHDTLCIWDSDAKEVICIQHFRNACFPGRGEWEGEGHALTCCSMVSTYSREVYTNMVIHCDIVQVPH